MNYFPFHLGDYAAHTAHLEPMEDLAYRRMLDLYYRTEAPLPDDWRDVARLIRMKDYGAEIEAVLSEFFTLTGEGWRHFRCDAEIERMQDKQAKAKASAAASVKARSTNAQRTLNERSTVVELPTPTPTPTPTPKKENPPASRPPPADAGTRASKKPPTGFAVTDELRSWVEAEHPALDWKAETESFRDYTFSTARSDWPGTWRNWMRKASKAAKPHQNASTQSFRERDAAALKAKSEAMMGSALPARWTGDFIDMEPGDAPRLSVR